MMEQTISVKTTTKPEIFRENKIFRNRYNIFKSNHAFQPK